MLLLFGCISAPSQTMLVTGVKEDQRTVIHAKNNPDSSKQSAEEGHHPIGRGASRAPSMLADPTVPASHSGPTRSFAGSAGGTTARLV